MHEVAERCAGDVPHRPRLVLEGLQQRLQQALDASLREVLAVRRRLCRGAGDTPRKLGDAVAGCLTHGMVRRLCRRDVGIDHAVKMGHQESCAAPWPTHRAPRLLRVEAHAFGHVVAIQAHGAEQLRVEPLANLRGLLHEGADGDRGSVPHLAPVVADASGHEPHCLWGHAVQEDRGLADLEDVLEGKVGVLADEAVGVLRALAQQPQHLAVNARCEGSPAALHHALQGAHRCLQRPPALRVGQEGRRRRRRLRSLTRGLARAAELAADVAEHRAGQGVVDREAVAAAALLERGGHGLAHAVLPVLQQPRQLGQQRRAEAGPVPGADRLGGGKQASLLRLPGVCA
mmetsp:Transcript_49287/g.157673  ORF Transcript_49287/g.157673 Transcript_49287/m.157673 type:complete len:345 (+) Transcript_49287:1034-2068(+)